MRAGTNDNSNKGEGQDKGYARSNGDMFSNKHNHFIGIFFIDVLFIILRAWTSNLSPIS